MRTASYVAALLILAASGLVSGLWTDRWARAGRLESCVQRLRQIPEEVGEWRGRDMTLDREVVEMAELAGYLLRQYQGPGGEALTVLLVVGRPGPISVHTPEVCYGGAGYEPEAPAARCPVGGGPASLAEDLWALDLAKPGDASDRLRILYGWTADGTWHASGNPRADFAGSPVLLKLYIVRPESTAGEPIESDAALRFARQFLPSARSRLFGAG